VDEVSTRPKSIKLRVAHSVIGVDENGQVFEDELVDEFEVHPGHYLYRVFKNPGVRAFVPGRGVRYSLVEDDQ
jgi:hypothetical protein